jgi:predicted DNA-binding transcriptional regulator AlpA
MRMANNVSEDITLDDIARDPWRVNALSAEATRQLIAKLEMARGALKARRIILSSEPQALTSVPDAPDRLLRVDEAARRIGIAVDTLYKNADEYPFTQRPRPRCLRFSEKGIAEYLKAKSAESDATSRASAASMWRNGRYGQGPA